MILWLLFLIGIAPTLGSFVPLPSYPLAVKTPYLSAWLPGDQASNVPTAQPEFWAGQPLTWKVMARVNGEIYSLFGCPHEPITPAEQISISYTATHTIVTLKAGESGLHFTLDFFSPVSVTNFTRQSIPYSYLTISIDNSTARAEVDVMTAIDESWSAQPGKMVMEWHEGNHSQSFIIKNYHQIDASEDQNDMATWGRVVLASNTSDNLSYQSASPVTILSQFSSHGVLSQEVGGYKYGDLVAFAHRFSGDGVNAETLSVTFGLGLQQDLNMFFGEEYEELYFEPFYPTTELVVDHFLEDEASARLESAALDQRVREIGERFSKNYADILEGTVRQIWGSIHISIPWGHKDTSYHLGFMKALSAGGRVSPVADLLPTALPALLVLAPDYIPLLLNPVLNVSLTWPKDYAIHDIGKRFPNASRPIFHDDECLPIQQTSALLWMVYAYQKVTGNTGWAKPYLPTLHKYAEYLVRNGLYPASERSAVHSDTRANQTLLAISASIGLTSYGALTRLNNYTTIGKSYAAQVLEIGTDANRTHLLTHYGGEDSSWITSYPFAYDKLLGLETFPHAAYEMQSSWYEDLVQSYGLQFSSDVDFTVAELAMMAAATSSEDVRNLVFDSLHRSITSGINPVPGPNHWNVVGDDVGHWRSARAQSSVGGYWMPAAVKMYDGRDLSSASASGTWIKTEL